jgi:glutamate-5-semialdehyde dehydrogenase
MTWWCIETIWCSFVKSEPLHYAKDMSESALEVQGRRVREAARQLAQASDERRRAVLLHVADQLEERSEELLAVNERDLAAYGPAGPGRDRLALTSERVTSMAAALREIASSPDPLFEIVDRDVRPNGLKVERLRVPLGVIGVVYENRPNVTSDVAALCIRSGNAAFLRGSSSAQASNQFIVDRWQDALEKEGLPVDAVALVQDTSHETASAFMQLTDVLDCLIPRGGPSLIAAMREHARVPYVLDGDGNCHVYVDQFADLSKAVAIVRNAKTSRPGVCNAAETLLVHETVAPEFLPRVAASMPEVQLRGDEKTRAILPSVTSARDEDFEEEFLDLILAVKVVESIDEAIEHVARYGTGHSEAIVTEDLENAEAWVHRVDAAAVLVNASTRFIDGGELGLGGEVGISTQKLHARGPMGLRELTCLKWVVRGEGQIR